jgi:hypothetical protein
VGDRVLHDRPTRAAQADRVGHRAVHLDHPLLGHHRGLGGKNRVAVVLVDQQAVRRHRIPAGQNVGEQQHTGGRVALVVADVAAAPEGHHHLVVPRRLVAGRARIGAVVQGGDLVDSAVDHPSLEPDDERQLPAVDSDRRQIGWPLGRVGKRGEVPGGAQVPVHDLGRGEAILVDSGAETGRLGLAVVRLLVGSREHRARGRMVGDRERAAASWRCAVAVAGGPGNDDRVPLRQPGDQTAEHARRHPRERRRHVDAAGSNPQMPRRTGVVNGHLDEHVATGDTLGVRRHDLDHRTGRHLRVNGIASRERRSYRRNDKSGGGGAGRGSERHDQPPN